MSRNRSSSLPSATAVPGDPFPDHLHHGFLIRSPPAIAGSISTDTDAPSRPLAIRIESSSELGPIRKRSASDPTSVLRVLRNPPLSASRDEEVNWSSEDCVDDALDAMRNKDTVRRYHALKELLATEYGYLEDLRFFVTVYLRNLPTLVMRSFCSTSTFASFTTGPSSSWMYSSASHASSITGQSIEPQTVSAPPNAFSKAPISRYIFTDHEVELLTRNGEEILQFHEHFVKELGMALEPLGFSNERHESLGPHVPESLQLANVDEAIRIVSTKFSTEASRFSVYQTFCAGHPEAMDVLRKALHQFPIELDTFEHRSSSIVFGVLENDNRAVVYEASSFIQKLSHNVNGSGSKSLSVGAILPPALEDRKRTLSLTSLDDRRFSKSKASSSPKSLKLRSSMTAMTAPSIASNNVEREDTMARSLDDGTASDLQRSATTSSGGTSVSEPWKDGASSSIRKIAMADYMIKPVQRICKYPLLLDQLQPSKALRDVSQKETVAGTGVDIVVESAAQAMRQVAASVDAARERQSIATQSSLIFSRICLGLQVQGVLPSGSFSYPYSGPPSSSRAGASAQTQNSAQIRLLTPSFLSSLGPCLLSGSLDVIHYSHSVNAWMTGTIKGKVKMKAKYLGIFLYDGGYLIFVKVGKGKKYEPRHWFALDGWDIVSIDDEEAMLPHSFRLSKAGQYFELAGSCVREKGIWLASIAAAVKHAPAWIGEPIPSFMCDGSKFMVESTSAPASDDGHNESIEPIADVLNTSSDVGGLSTIWSIPDVCADGSVLESDPRSTRTEPFFASLREHVHGKSGRKKRLSTKSGGGSKCRPQPPQIDEEVSSRRSSSSTSVMSIFSPMHMTSIDKEKERGREKEKESETVLITRSSATVRQSIDFGLQDVISATCASARAAAAWKGRMDLGPGTTWGSTKAKTGPSTTMGSMSRGIARLSKHESVCVPRKRTFVTTETLYRSAAASAKPTSGRKNVKKLSLTSFSYNEYEKSTPSLEDESTPTAPPDLSSQNLSSQEITENLSATSISTTLISVRSQSPSQRPSRSFVQNVKDLFHFRPVIASPVSVIISHPTQNSLQSPSYVEVVQRENKAATETNLSVYPAHGLLKRFTKDAGRAHRKCATEGDEVDFVTITSIHEAEEDVVSKKFPIAMPVIAAPMMVS